MFVDISDARIFIKAPEASEQTSLPNNTHGSTQDALFLHGVPDSAELWTPIISEVDQDYRCFAPDLPGFYRSGMPSDFRFDLQHYADFIDELVTKLNLRTPLTLIMHDWGGIFGLLWALSYPHKVQRIIGGDFPFSHLYRWHAWARVWRKPILGEFAMACMNRPLFHWAMQRGAPGLSRAHINAVYDRAMRQSLTRRTILQLYRSANPELFLPWSSKQARLAAQVPIDLIWGANDPYVATQEARLIHARSVNIVEHCGHWVPSEAPEHYIHALLEPGEVKK